jgi:hypothetical protein
MLLCTVVVRKRSAERPRKIKQIAMHDMAYDDSLSTDIEVCEEFMIALCARVA